MPAFYVVKSRSASATNWRVFHHKVATDPETDYLNLDSTAVVNDLATNWNDTAPTTTTISLGTASDVNGSGATFVAYVFAEIEGYSKFGV